MPQKKSAFLETAAQAIDAGDILNIFLRFWGFWGSFSYKNVSYIKKCVVVVGRGEKPKKHRREWCLASLLTEEIAIAGDSNTP